MDTKQRIHPLDRLIADDSSILLEALVPFVEYPFKKPLVLFIKYRELNSIMRSLDDRAYIAQCGFDCHPDSTEDMISDMCRFLPNSFASSIKQMKQMMNMMEMMNSMSDMQNAMNSMSDMQNAMNSMSDMQNAMNSMSDMQNAMNSMSGIQDMIKGFSSKPDDEHESPHDADLFENVMSILDNDGDS